MSEHDWNLELLQERLAELEMALFNEGWMRLGQQYEREFSREALGEIAYLARLMYLKNPLIRRGVNVQAFYVFGQGVSISHPDEAVNDALQAFLADSSNRGVLTSNQAMLAQERQLQLDGNLFFVFFADAAGRVRVRTIALDEMREIVSDPEDAATPWFYQRQWQQQALNLQTGAQEISTHTAWYPDWRYRPASKPDAVGGRPVRWDQPVMHVRTGGLADMQWGVSEVYPQLDWARAYKEFLEDWATLTRAYSRFAHKLTVPGGARGVAAAKAKVGTTYASSSALAEETNPPPTVGSMFIGGQGVDLQAMRIGGANVSADDGRRLLLMVAAGAGLPETFFGDASVGTVATAKSLDRPTELQMRARQTLWADVLRDVLLVVLGAGVRAGLVAGQVIPEPDGTPRVALSGDVDAAPLIEFPPILEHDITEQVGAIVSAATLDGKTPAGTMDDETLIRLLLGALGVQDVDGVLERLEKEEGEEDMDGVDEPEEEPEPERTFEQAAEAVMVAAVRELREAVARLMEADVRQPKTTLESVLSGMRDEA